MWLQIRVVKRTAMGKQLQFFFAMFSTSVGSWATMIIGCECFGSQHVVDVSYFNPHDSLKFEQVNQTLQFNVVHMAALESTDMLALGRAIGHLFSKYECSKINSSHFQILWWTSPTN